MEIGFVRWSTIGVGLGRSVPRCGG